MNAQLTVPAGFRERSGVNSQVLARPGFPQYGVMFCTSDSPSPQDFDTSLILGAQLEDTKKASTSENRFFRILGGYYFSPKAGGRGTTTEVFGNAGDAAFGIREGGDVVIGDNWTTLWKTSKHLDENVAISDTIPAQAGWTFIVEPKYGNKVFPRSKDPLALWIDCPQIEGIELFYKTPTPTEQPVEFTAIVGDGYVENFRWDFGDGNDPSDTGTNGLTQHTYLRQEGDTTTHTVSLVVSGYGNCTHEAKVDVEIPAIPCPTIESFTLSPDPAGKESQRVSAMLAWSGGDPASVSIDWGDGSGAQAMEGNEAAHTYERPIGDDTSYLVSVKLSGPASCGASASAKITIPGICPKVAAVNLEDLSQTEYNQTVRATVSMKDDIPAESYVWNWGDKSPLEVSNESSNQHTYQKTKGEEKYTVIVQANGPGKCVSEAQAVSLVGAGPGCPVIEKLSFKLDPAKDGKVKVHAEVEWKEGDPGQVEFDWGDGQIDENVNASVATHEYPEPIGVFDSYDVSVSLSGPGECSDSHTDTVNIPAKACARIKSVNITVSNTSATEQAVKAVLDLEGSFETYTYNWGDGHVEGPTSATSCDHVYSRSPQDRTFTVTVSGSGPGPCEGDGSTKHDVPRQEKVIPPPPPPTPEMPAICKYMPYIVAFLGALSLGHLALLITSLNTAATDNPLAWGAAIVSVLLLIIAIIVWFRLCKPDRCGWLAVGWVTFLGASIPIFNAVDLAGQEPIIPTVISFVIGAVFGFLWFRSCSPKSKSQVFITYFVLLIIAGLIAGLGTTPLVMKG